MYDKVPFFFQALKDFTLKIQRARAGYVVMHLLKWLAVALMYMYLSQLVLLLYALYSKHVGLDI